MINKLKTVKKRYACENALHIKGRFEKGKFDKENRWLSL